MMNRLLLLLCLVPLCLVAAPAVAQDVDPPVIEILESGVPLVDGSLFARSVTPVIQVTDASPTTVDSQLDGAAFTSGSTVSGEGLHELSVTATDDAGNSSSTMVTFEIDTVPPVFGAILPVSGTLTAASEVTLQGQVTGATGVTVDGQAATLVGEDFTAGPYTLSEGERVWNLTAVDAVGNSAETSHRVVRDSTPPSLSIDQPQEGALRKQSPVDVVGTVSDPHLESVTVGGTETTVTGSTFLAQNVPLGEGSTQIVAEATDAAGNAAQATRTVSLDTQPPSLAVTDPAAGTVVPDGTIAVSGTASDPHLDRVEVDGVAAQLSVGAWTGQATLQEGGNTVTVEAFDGLGWSTVATVNVIRDSEAPAIQIDQPADGAYFQASAVDVGGTVGYEDGITVTLNGIDTTLDTAPDPATFLASDVPLVEGENRLIARVTDSLGNQGAHTLIVYKDTTAPTLERVEPGDGALAIPPDSVFEVTFSEPLGALAAGAWTLETEAGSPLAADETVDGALLAIQPQAPLPSKTGVRLVLTAGIVDRAGNALEAPPTLTFTTLDVEAPPAPTLAAQPPGHLCAPSIALSGTAETEAVVTVVGGASGGETRAGTDGAFALSVELLPGRLNRLDVTASDRDGNTSEPLTVEVVHDCDPPLVTGAGVESDTVTVAFSEPVDPPTVPGAVTVSTGSGTLTGTVTVTADGTGAAFTPDQPLPTEPIRLDVSRAVRDLAGNPLGYPYAELFGGAVTSSFVSGRVLDAATGRPLPGTTVVVDSTDGVVHPEPQPEATTGDDGRFRIPVAAGTHSLFILRTGYTPAFRTVASAAGQGGDTYDPRLTPASASQTVPATGGAFTTEKGLTLDIPSGALASNTSVAVTALEEQALPALLPYGWSPRGAAWVDLGGESLASAATLTLPVDAPDGTSLAFARLDLATLQWHVEAVETVAGGTVTGPVSEETGYVAVEADGGSLAPPAPVAGTVLGSSAAPAGGEVAAASVSFDPTVVLPSQRAEVTVDYTLADGVSEVPSGLPLTLAVREELTLLDGTVRTQPPYEADLTLYHTGGGAPRSRFDLRPSTLAQSLPLEVGAEDVTVRPYAGETVLGNVLGPAGGTVSTPEGDRVDLPSGAVSEPTAVLLERRAQADLPIAVPTGTAFLGALDLDLSGRTLEVAAALTLELGAAPAAGEEGLLFQVTDPGTGPAYRPVAALAATATGWTTGAIDPLDLPWPGVHDEGLYVFARLTTSVGYLRGTVYGVGGAPLAGALVTAATATEAVPWIQLSSADGSYVLPVPVDAVTATAAHLATGDLGSGTATVATADARVDLDLFLQVTGPEVVEVNPADGAVDVTPGIEPTVTFSESVDPTPVANGVRLYDGADQVPVSHEVQGTLVRLRPQATLRPGAVHEVRVNTAVKDLQGNRLQAAVTSSFTTLEITSNDQLDLTRVHLFEPDAAGMARVLGRPGAVPAGSLVFVENLSRLISTPSVTAGQDGGFEVHVEAALSDRLLLHVVITGENEVVIELTPFLSADGLGAHVAEGATTFTTLEDLTVRVEEGTFVHPTVVRAEARSLDASPAPMPDDFSVLYAYELDFGGAEALEPLQVTVPAPVGVVAEDGPFLLTRTERVLGEPYWMLYDLMRLDDGTLTTELPPDDETQASLEGLGRREPVTRLASMSPFGLRGLLPPALTFGAPEPIAAPVRQGDGKDYLPSSVNPGLYTVMSSSTHLDFVGIPFAPGMFAYMLHTGLEGAIASINQKIEQHLEYDAVLMATRRGETFSLEGRDLATGYKLFEQSFDPPEPDTLLLLPPGIYADSDAPAPVIGDPLQFLPVTPGREGVTDLAPGIEAELTGVSGETGTLTVRGSLGAGQAEVQVQILGLDDDKTGVTRSQSSTDASPGDFELTTAITPGKRYLVAVGAVLPVDQALRIGFSEGLAGELPGIEVRDALERSIDPEIEPLESTNLVRIAPSAGWRAGESYTLHLGPELADGFGNTWDETLEVEFEIASSEPLATYGLDAVRDVARLGSLLFVAAGNDGLAVLDAADPANLTSYVQGGGGPLYFPFPYGDPVTGVSVDPHGRVLVVGGGVGSFGQLKIFDPADIKLDDIAAAPDDLTVRSVAYNGSTIVSDKFGGTGTNLPEGTPHRVAVLSDDQRDAWRVGQDAPPSDVTVTPTLADPPTDGTEYEITVDGSGMDENLPVTFRNLTRGRWVRDDTEADHTFSLTARVAAGDSVELLRNRKSLAYVSIRGVGVSVVDVNAFYNETPEDPTDPSPESDVLGTFTGYEGEQVKLCNTPVTDIGGAILDLGTLFDQDDGHPLTLVTLIGFRGVLLLESALGDVGDITQYNDETCLEIDGSAWVSGLEVLEDYPFDLDGDGRYEPDEVRDYLLVAHRTAGILILDANNRDDVSLVGQIRLPGQASHLGVDRARRRLFVAGSGAGLYVVDLNRAPTTVFQDADGDGVDDRVLETVELEGTTNAPLFLVPELGLAYAGGLDRGVTGVAIDEPQIVALAENEPDPETGAPAASPWRPIDRLAPFGVPFAPESSEDGAPNLPGSFRLLAHLPGVSGSEVKLDVLGVGPGGIEIRGAGDPATVTDLPPSALTGADGVVLKRLSDNPMDEGSQIFLSEEIAALADLRADSDFVRTSLEEDECTRCDPPEGARELLSGDRIAVRIPDALRSTLGSVYGHNRLDDAELELASVRWETSPSVRQQPTLNASTGTGDVAPGTLLHSGEFRHGATDLTVKSRGFDVAFGRTYRNQTVGAGPLGPGWNLTYRQRLRELPNGNVEYYDGTGRRELFELKDGEDGEYDAPTGRFVTLSKTAQGWVMIQAHKSQLRFDRTGRLAAIADAVKDSDGTGNEMRFGHDLAGRLVRITDTLERDYFLEYDAEGRLTKLTDFDGREVRYEYDLDGRLVRVLSPEVTTGIETPGRLTTTYAYDPGTGDLAGQLTRRDNLASITDPRGIEWLGLAYTDASGDGRTDEVTTETWGGDSLTIAYDFTGRTATVTDRRSSTWLYEHDADGHPTKVTDPAGEALTMAYDAEGLVTSMKEPLDRVTAYTYDTAGDRRSRGNVTEVSVTAGTGGANGSSGTLTTAITYDPRTNLPKTITDPRGGVTTYTRDAVGLPFTIARPEGATTLFVYNSYGQVTKVVNPNGHETEYAYFDDGESEGFLEHASVNPGGLGLVTRYETDARGNVTRAIDARGTRHTQTYNELDWPVETVAAEGELGFKTTTLYDEVGRVTEIHEPFGQGGQHTATKISYGPLGEVVRVDRDLQPGVGIFTKYEYDKNRNVTAIVDPESHRTELQYDARNLATTRIRGKGSAEEVEETFAYDAEGRQLARTDGRSNVWTRKYDGYGRLAAVEDPLDNRTQQTYDDAGNPVEARSTGSDGLLARSKTDYDLLGRPVEQTRWLWGNDSQASSPVTTRIITYDPVGNVTSTSDALARTTSFTYDAAERLVSRLDPAGNETTYQLDSGGQPETVILAEVLPGGGTAETVTTFEYDALGRPTAAIDPLGNTTRWVLDARGHARIVIDPEGHQTVRTHDGLNRLTSLTQPEGVTTQYRHDGNGNRTSYKDALGNETTWTYDDLDRVTNVTYPDGTTESYQYDTTDNVTKITQPSGTVVDQTFDNANRLISRTITRGAGVEGPTTESFIYDGIGRMTEATSGLVAAGGITTKRTYDSFSRITSESSAAKETSYTLDAVGNVTQITYPSGTTVNRTPDALDRLAAIPGVATYGYRGPDLVAQKTAGALSGSTTFDGARRPKTRTAASSAGTRFQEALSWSPRSLLTGSARRERNDTAFSFELDGAGRLKGRSQVGELTPGAPAAETFTFDYDAAQSLTSTKHAGLDVPPAAIDLPAGSMNRPTSIDGVNLTWDANGNLTAKGNQRFHYDWRDRLVRVTTASGVELARYAYDAFNRLVSKSVGSTTEITAWAGWQPIETSEAGSVTERRTYGLGLDELVRLEIDLDEDGVLDQTYTPLYEQSGNLVAMADPAGEIIERYLYNPYGFRLAVTDSVPPEVLQLLYRSGALNVELSEEILRAVLRGENETQEQSTSGGVTAQAAASTPPPVSLVVTATGEEIPVDIDFPVELGRFAFRRAVITPTGTVPDPGTEVTLTIEAEGLEDTFFNRPATAFSQSFTWPDPAAGTDEVLQDTAAPRVEEVLTREGHLEIAFSEEVDLASAQAAIQIDGATLAWQLDATGYRLTSVDPLATGAQTLTIGTGVQDLMGTPLATPLTLDLTDPIATAEPSATALASESEGPSDAGAANTLEPRITSLIAPDSVFYRLDEAVRLLTSSIGNRFGFHGRELDFDTGLVYFRNRWYDPELGRFITTDPLGYVDGPNLYQYALNNPVSFSDPMGLCLFLEKYPGPCSQYYDDVVEAVSTAVVTALNLHEGKLSTSSEDLNDPKKGEVIADSLGMVAGAPLTLGEASGEWVATIDAIYRTPDTDERLALYEELHWQTPGMVLEVSAVGEGVNFSFAAARRAPGVLLREIGEQGVGVVDDALQGRSSGNLFHYTRSDVAPLIEGGGLRPGADGKIYLTPRGDLSPLQAQIDLALPPNRGLPDALFEVDVVGLDRLGIPRSAPQQTTRMFNMPGGGQEVVVPYAIPSEVLKRVR